MTLQTLQLNAVSQVWRSHFPGVLASAVVAIAASFLASHYGAPVMLFALLLGLAMNFLSQESVCRTGIEWTSKTVLRAGVALLGLRITLDQVTSLGWQPIAVVVCAVLLTIAVSMVVARLMGFHVLFGLLSGGATAICGASAAMALSAALPAHPQKERATLFTVIGVSVLSTLSMVLYPMLMRLWGMDDRGAGFFIGGTIHDVAQVVGAGYSLSHEAGDIATLIKMTRVAMLLPVILLATTFAQRYSGGTTGEKPPLLPGFVLAFAALLIINSAGWIPRPVVLLGNETSSACLIASMAAIGMKTQLKKIIEVGFKPVVLMVGETAFIAGLVATYLAFFRGA